MLSYVGWIYGISAFSTLLFGILFGIYLILEAYKSESKILTYFGLFVLFSGLSFLGNTLDFVFIVFVGENLDYGINLVGILGNMWIGPIVVTGLYIATKLIMKKPNWYIIGIYLGLLIIFEFLIIFDPFNSIYYENIESGEGLLRVYVVPDSFIQIILIIFLFTEFIFFFIGFLIKAIKSEGLIRKKFILLALGFLLIIISAILEPVVNSGAIFISLRLLFLCGFILWYYALREEQEKVEEPTIRIEESLFRISGSKQLEKELNNLKNLKAEILNRTSHELKTPLISIKGFSELLLELHKEELTDDVKVMIKEIKRGSDRLEKIINSLIKGKKLELNDHKLNLSQENISEMINACVDDYHRALKTRDHSLVMDLPKELKIIIDRKKIKEVLNNLLSNAIKYTPVGGKISIKVKELKNLILISVKDSGIGFTNEEKERIFQKFGKIERYGQGWAISPEGMGFGLYFSKKFAEMHNGRLWMKSDGRNKGSTFYLTLPKVKKN